jgi:hypothetical protein
MAQVVILVPVGHKTSRRCKYYMLLKDFVVSQANHTKKQIMQQLTLQ